MKVMIFPLFVSFVWICQLSASKPWHPSKAFGEQKTFCLLSFWSRAGSPVCRRIIVLFEGLCAVYIFSLGSNLAAFSRSGVTVQLSASVRFLQAQLQRLSSRASAAPAPFLFLTPLLRAWSRTTNTGVRWRLPYRLMEVCVKRFTAFHLAAHHTM